MPGWRSFITNLKAATSQRADWWTPLTLLVPDSNTLAALLQDYSQRGEIGAVSADEVNFVAEDLTKRPIRLTKDGRIAILTELPVSVQLTGAAGTQYIYADLDVPGADHTSAVDLIATDTPPASNIIEYRKYLGAVGWDGAAIVGASVVSYETPPPAGFITTARSYLAGLGLARAVVDPSNDVTIGIGQCRDSTDVDTLVSPALITKRLDAAWTVGTNVGGLDTGTKAVSTWYHVFLIKRPDTGMVDALFSLSATAPTMPTNYTRKRRIGSVFNGAANALISFSQVSDEFLWTTPLLDIAGDLTEGNTARTLSVPTGVIIWAKLNVSASFTVADQSLWVTELDATTDIVPSASAAPLATLQAGTTTNAGFGPIIVRTNTQAQIRTRSTGTLDGIGLNLCTLGWIDRRGRDD